MTAVTDESQRPPGYYPWNDNLAVSSLVTIDEEHTDLGRADTNRATNMGWNSAGGACSSSNGYGWCSGSGHAQVNYGWGEVVVK
jgi:hypothetical protein